MQNESCLFYSQIFEPFGSSSWTKKQNVLFESFESIPYNYESGWAFFSFSVKDIFIDGQQSEFISTHCETWISILRGVP